MPEVKFRVDGGETLSFIERVKGRSNDLSRTLMDNAAKENASAKGQLKLILDQIYALEKRNRLAQEINNITGLHNVNERLKNLPNRQQHIASLVKKNEDDYRNDIIDEATYNKRNSRLNNLWDRAQPKAIGNEFKEFLAKQTEQLKETQLSNKFSREQVEAIKNTARETVSSIKRGDDTLSNILDRAKTGSAEEKLIANLVKEQLAFDKKKESEERSSGTGNWTGLLKALTFDKTLGLIGAMPGAKNELELLKPMMSLMGMAMGGAIGSGLDLANVEVLGTGLGKSNFGMLGASLGEAAGEIFSTALQRSFSNRDNLTKTNYALQALIGQNMGIDAFGVNGLGGTGKSNRSTDLTKYGLDYVSTAQLQLEIAQRQGTGNNLNENAENLVAAQSGLGIAKETTLALIELARSTREDVGNPLRSIVTIANGGSAGIFRGDRTFLNEYINKQVQLTKEVLRTTDMVSTAKMFEVMSRLGGMGGQFDLRDPRSVGLMSSMQGALASGGSTDFQKVANFLGLKNAMPGAGIVDILIEQQKGLGSELNLKTVLQNIKSHGGDKDQMILQIADAFGWQNNLSAAKTLFNNMNALIAGTTSLGNIGLGGEYNENSIRSLAQQQTSKYSKSTAEIENAFIESVTGGLGVMSDKMKGLFGDMIDGVTQYIDAKINSMVTDVKNGGRSNGIRNGYGRGAMSY